MINKADHRLSRSSLAGGGSFSVPTMCALSYCKTQTIKSDSAIIVAKVKIHNHNVLKVMVVVFTNAGMEVTCMNYMVTEVHFLLG